MKNVILLLIILYKNNILLGDGIVSNLFNEVAKESAYFFPDLSQVDKICFTGATFCTVSFCLYVLKKKFEHERREAELINLIREANEDIVDIFNYGVRKTEELDNLKNDLRARAGVVLPDAFRIEHGI